MNENKHLSQTPNLTSPLGCQLWVEPGDSPTRLRSLMQGALDSGLSRLRIFLLWTRIEHHPGTFDFATYDAVFEAAAEFGLGIKATLTVNSGPWHVGTPCALHSHTGFLSKSQIAPMERYIRECVSRYAEHPALAQWLLWNEPHGAFLDHTEDNLIGWRAWLEKKYEDRIGQLNLRWLTGFPSFNEIPWPEEIPHPFHRNGSWSPYPPRLDEMAWRADRLTAQVAWVANEVRRYDSTTELCINPIFTIENKAAGATDMLSLSATVDRMGASYHPVFWHEHLSREEYPGLIGAGVRALVHMGGGKPVELTEVISGNTFSTGSRSCAVAPSEIARFYLCALACGAETVTGWCLNARPSDSEAGEFALLNDCESISPRGMHLARLARVLAASKQFSGAWSPAESEVLITVDRKSQAIEVLDSEGSNEKPLRPGRGPHDAGRGAWLMAERVMEEAYSVGILDLDADLESISAPGRTLFVSHNRAWSEENAQALLSFARRGGTLVFDALCGRKDYDSRCYLPWPGHLAAKIGLITRELETAESNYPLESDGRPAGRAATLRTLVQADRAWRALPELRFADDASAAFLERSFGQGKILYARFPIGPSLLLDRNEDRWFRRLLRYATVAPKASIRPIGGISGCVTVPILTQQGELICIISPTRVERKGKLLRFTTSAGSEWEDFWSESKIQADEQGEFVLACEEGIALLWRAERITQSTVNTEA